MQKSSYNIVVDGEGEELNVFNANTSAFVSLRGKAKETFIKGEGAYAKELEDAGIFVNDISNEQEFLKECFDWMRNDLDVLEITLIPTYRCNLKCPYCYEMPNNLSAPTMDKDVIAKMYDFVSARYNNQAFSEFRLTWFGGEPTLCAETIAQVTNELRSWCKQKNVEFHSNMMSNCTLIDDSMAESFAKCGIDKVSITVDGMPERHNNRRLSKDGTPTFDKIMQAIDALKNHGIETSVLTNLDKKSAQDYPHLRELLNEKDVPSYPAVINDYNKTFGLDEFTANEFDLFERKEYCQVLFNYFAETDYDAESLHELLLPKRNFCNGQKENHFIIDGAGDVYSCDGWVGHKDHVIFNLFDGSNWCNTKMTNYNPLNDEECVTCRVLPLCKGQCSWNRELLPEACHPFKHTIEDYVRAYRGCFEGNGEDFQILAQPIHDLKGFLCGNQDCVAGITGAYAGDKNR